MIVPMNKYSIVLHRDVFDDFLRRLQDLGLVDVTTADWEAGEDDLRTISDIEKHRHAKDVFKSFRLRKDFVPGKPYTDGAKAFDRYLKAVEALDTIGVQIERARDEMEDISVWGALDKAKLQELLDVGVRIHYFSAYTKDFQNYLPAWREQYIVEEVAQSKGMSYFVVVTDPDAEVAINAHESKPPSSTVAEKQIEIAAFEEDRRKWIEVMSRAAASEELIAAHAAELEESLHFSRVAHSGREEAEGSLLLLEGWATREDAEKVDALLDASPDLVYLRERPSPDDDAPVKLHNKPYPRLFEIIGNFYLLPRYGSMDLTPYFAPFFMIFFGFCLGDGGYGLIFLVTGIVLRLRARSETLRQIGTLTIWLGSATMLFGLLTGLYFGIQFENLAAFKGFRFLGNNELFALSMALGGVQLLFAWTLKVINRTRQYGFRYALSTIGWIIAVVSSLLAFGLPRFGVEGFSIHSPLYWGVFAAGMCMVLFLNSPGKSVLANFGLGLWNTYTGVTGLLGDVLSYIRLFAIGLSGGVLAIVFNQLAMGLSPNIPVVKQLVMLIILLIGHGINLFMSTLGSLVHPMRLTFVEFYKNAGFEATQREFTPFRRTQKTIN